jgi:uncharacterized protein (TIGR03546 family)
MTLILKQLLAFFKLLNSDKDTGPIAAGLVCGMILGLTPSLSLQTLLVLILLFFLRIQIGAALIAAFFFKLGAFALDPAFDVVGRAVLEQGSLKPTFTALYQMPIVPFTRFNNSIVMGSGIVSLILAVPAYFAFKKLVMKYRATVVARFERSAIWKAWKATTVYQWYEKYEQLHG